MSLQLNQVNKSSQPGLDPAKIDIVLKNKGGREVGRIPATARNAEVYITQLASSYGVLTADYVHNEDSAFLSFLHGGGQR